jgi:hypothetical protein
LIVHSGTGYEPNTVGTDISVKLISWSGQIQEDFKRQNVDINMNMKDEQLIEKLVEETSISKYLTNQVAVLTKAVMTNVEPLNTHFLNSEVVAEAKHNAFQQQFAAIEELLSPQKYIIVGVK